jgi:heme oxygenase
MEAPQLPIGARLKTETMAAHQSLEAHPRLLPLGEGTLTRAGYGAVLQRFLPFWEAVEAAAYGRADVAEILPDMHERVLSPKIAADLAALEMGRLPVPAPRVDWVTDLPSAMGTIYVLEGSTLGGRVIIKRVMDQLGLTPENGAAYYHGYGADTGTKWKAFQTAIHSREWTAAEADAIVAAANATFAALQDWMDVEPTLSYAA